MNPKDKIYKTILIGAMLVAGLSNSAFCQQILNVTEIPHNIVDNREPENIRVMDGKVIVPIYVTDNEIYEFLPNVEVDSFPTPEDVFSVLTKNIGGTFYAEYKPHVGFVHKDMINYNWEEDLSIEGDYIAFTESTPTIGLNNNILHLFPTSADSLPDRMSTIAVYNSVLDSFVYVNVFAEKRKYKLKSDIEGDYIYVNIPLTWEEPYDLIFMGDTLTYENTIWSRGSNYLSKINFKTGEKEWTRHIGYGDVHQIVVDDQHRINMEIETSAPAMYNKEWQDPDYDPATNGIYDRLIYRMSTDGEYMDHTYIRTHNLSSIYEVEFDRDGSFQAFGLVQGPIHVHVEEDSLDFTDVMSFEESEGLVLVYDNNLEYQWGKKIISDGITLVTAVNRNPNGDYVIATQCEDTDIEFDGLTFEGPPGPSNLEVPFDPAILTRFDLDGNVLGSPIFGNHKSIIFDIQALGKDHYLLLYRKINYYVLDFIDTSFTDKNVSYLIEYEGDIFDIMTSVEEYFAAEAIRISPNPASRGEDMDIKLPEEWQDEVTIHLYTADGRKVDTQIIKQSNITKYNVPDNIAEGLYYLNINNQKNTKTIPIYIH